MSDNGYRNNWLARGDQALADVFGPINRHVMAPMLGAPRYQQGWQAAASDMLNAASLMGPGRGPPRLPLRGPSHTVVRSEPSNVVAHPGYERMATPGEGGRPAVGDVVPMSRNYARGAAPEDSAGSPYRPGSPVAAYEAYLNSLPIDAEPMSYWAFKASRDLTAFPPVAAGIGVGAAGYASDAGARPKADNYLAALRRGHEVDDAHARQAWLDDEARGNLAAQPYPAEWGVMPSAAGPFGNALAAFRQTIGTGTGPVLPVSRMSPEARADYLGTAATLLGLGENDLAHALRPRNYLAR